jgi:insulysin
MRRQMGWLWWLVASVAVADVVAPDFSDRSYRALTLDNQLKVLLISDPTSDRAAASMDVAVGSNHDPQEYPGLAHFLEHMLFLGTDLFPEAGEYQQYISASGGSHNAFTAPENTNYFFDVQPNALPGALDRFSRFFVAPRFDPTYVRREVNAVHSEYQSKLQNEGNRSFAVTKEGLNPAHPFQGFHSGNLETLDQLGLVEAVTTFYQAMYSADRMALAVLSSDSLDTLESLVRDRFSNITNNQLGPIRTLEPLLDRTMLPLEVRSQPIGTSRRLSLLWPVPASEAHQGSKPMTYLGHLIGHEGPGSLFDILKSKGWINGLSAGPSLAMRDSELFGMSVSITEEGYRQRDAIIEALFAQLHQIEREGIAPWRFTELQQVTEANFRFAEDASAQGTVTTLSEAMQTTPIRELWTRDRLLTRFDPDLVMDYLSWLTPENLYLRVTAPEALTDQVTQYYPTPFGKERIQDNRLQAWQRARHGEAPTIGQLPAPNPFIATTFTRLVPSDRPEGVVIPTRVIEQPGIVAYALSETRFGQPRSDLYIRLRTPLASQDADSKVMADLLADYLNDRLSAMTYDAAIAGASLGVQSTQSGFTLQASGYHDGVMRLVPNVLETLPPPLIDAGTFARLKARQLDRLSAYDKQRPVNRLLSELTVTLMPREFLEADRLAAIVALDRETFHEYQKAVFTGLVAEAFLHAPLTLAESTGSLKRLIAKLPIDPDGAGIELSTGLWPEGAQTEFRYNHPDHASVLAFVIDDDSASARLKAQLLANLIEAPFYTQLRTEKQLGYLTFAMAFPVLNRPILAGAVQSPNVEATVLAAEIKGFFRGFRETLAQLDPETFNRAKAVLKEELESPWQTQSDLSSALWGTIGLRRSFDERTQRLAELDALSRNDLLVFYDALLSQGGLTLVASPTQSP